VLKYVYLEFNIIYNPKKAKMNKNLHFQTSSLFDMIELVQRPIPEQRKFEIEYYDLLIALPGIILKAFEISNATKRNKNPLSMNRNWFANEMSGNVIDLIAQSFPMLVKYTGRGSYFLLLNFKYECYIKKLTKKRLFPMYNHSRTSKRLTNQVASKIEEPIPVIYMGWTINKTNDQIFGFHAVCIKGDERLWNTDLTAIQKPNENELKITPQAEIETNLVVVTVKGKRKAN